jgi:hypothetical protein
VLEVRVRLRHPLLKKQEDKILENFIVIDHDGAATEPTPTLTHAPATQTPMPVTNVKSPAKQVKEPPVKESPVEESLSEEESPEEYLNK